MRFRRINIKLFNELIQAVTIQQIIHHGHNGHSLNADDWCATHPLRVDGDRWCRFSEFLEPRELYLVQRPSDADATFRLGELAAANGRPSEARRRFTDAWELSGNPAAAKRLVELAERAGDPAAARLWRTRAGLPPASPSDDTKAPAAIP